MLQLTCQHCHISAAEVWDVCFPGSSTCPALLCLFQEEENKVLPETASVLVLKAIQNTLWRLARRHAIIPGLS